MQGLKLCIGEEVTVIWSRTEPDWYCLDLSRPLAANDLRLEELEKSGNFSLLASKLITRFLRRRAAKSKDLLVIFYRAERNRTTDFTALRTRLGYLMSSCRRSEPAEALVPVAPLQQTSHRPARRTFDLCKPSP